MRLITDDNVDQLMSMSYSKNIMDLTKKLDIFKDIKSRNINQDILEDEDVTSNKETKEMNEFVQNYIRYVNMSSNIKDNKIDMKSKINEVIEETPSDSLEIVYPQTPESSQEIVERGPRTPSMSPPTTPDMEPIQMNDNLSLNFGVKEYNDFYDSLPIKSKKMIYNLPERDRLLILKKAKLMKEQKMQAELESRQQPEVEKMNPPEDKNLLEYNEEKPDGSESKTDDSNSNLDSGTNSESSSNSGEVKKIVM